MTKAQISTSEGSAWGLGLMSGTSCDGIDAAVVRITDQKGRLNVELHAFTTEPYAEPLRAQLLKGAWTAEEVCGLNWELGRAFATVAAQVLRCARRTGFRPSFVASHGHTLVHLPPTAENPGSGTLQVGDPAWIADATGLPVVSGFRTRDMVAGGQGAPLVPYADWMLFRRRGRRIWCLNIGGIANVTSVSARLSDVVAFDTGPGNMLIDGAVRIATGLRKHMDRDGELAARGSVVPALYDRLMSHPYFERRPPKSTGVEEFGSEAYLQPALATLGSLPSPEDLVATVTQVVAASIVAACRRFATHGTAPNARPVEVILSGGGAHNRELVRLVREGFHPTPVTPSDDRGIPGDAREAVAFAILGYETLHGRPANVPSATGARRRVRLGQVTWP